MRAIGKVVENMNESELIPAGDVVRRLLTVFQAADRLKVCVRTVRDYYGKKQALPVVRLGRAVRIDERDLEAFIATRRS